MTPDEKFADPRLASVLDVVEGDRSDLDAYAHIAAEFGARRVLDIGCGTGIFALSLADRGHDVVGLEPARASRALDGGGTLVFETRIPSRHAWQDCTRENTYDTTDVAGIGEVTTWTDVVDVALPLVTFRATYVFAADGATLVSDSTLSFRERDEVVTDLERHDFTVVEVRDAPDRPGREWVFVARAG